MKLTRQDWAVVVSLALYAVTVLTAIYGFKHGWPEAICNTVAVVAVVACITACGLVCWKKVNEIIRAHKGYFGKRG